ncbi:hypothetical protein [Actinomadura macrotermitis]|uniref:Uncharacterized protein n=1 Tax=Actinomadura macrotermitis TaxID=2585200 RepID=A0A7K0C6A3_9ACTN|nr:hypothetical protein [Actinomadura macrotermitis]MQY08612.1 hypothetical protein [Actinomadura macrotermitis]
MPDRQRPANARDVGDGMKLHRRVLRLNGRDHTVIGLRPGTTARFSTNRYHGTWHVLSDQHGARLLGRLLWGLSYQARPGTLLLIDRPFIVPTPFDADPADPVVIAPGWATPFGEPAARDLARRLPLASPSEGTVRWHTRGLDAALDGRRPRELDIAPWWDERSGRVERLKGMIVLTPCNAREAREWALRAARLNPANRWGMAHEYVGGWEEGEIQVFRSFRRKVGMAARARADVLARPDAPADPDELRPLIWDRHYEIDRAMRRLRRSG